MSTNVQARPPSRRPSVRTSNKVYSVSFQVSFQKNIQIFLEKSGFSTQDNGFLVQRTTANEAKNRWQAAANFDEGLRFPIVEIPRQNCACPESDGDEEDHDDCDTARIIPRTKGARSLSKR